jgi:hypothetical protein
MRLNETKLQALQEALGMPESPFEEKVKFHA